MTIKPHCCHRNHDWYSMCAVQYSEELLALQQNKPKHGFGVPPFEKGMWFCFYGDKDKWCMTDNSEDVIGKWNQTITEYYGPIPLKEWDEDEINPLQQILNTEPPASNVSLLTKAVMELQEKSK